MSAKADIIEEFAKSFSSSWFGAKDLGIGPAGMIIPCQVARDRMVPPGILPITYMADNTGRMLSYDVRWDIGRTNLIRTFPNLGAVKAGPTVAYLGVKPRRQFQKGYVPENIDCHIPNKEEIRKVFPRLLLGPNTKRLVWQVFNRTYWTPQAAIKLIEEGEGIGYPLSAHWSVYVSGQWEDPLLMRNNKIVGAYRDKRFKLLPDFLIYKDEFKRDTKEFIW